MGQLDVIRYPEGTFSICENQGLLAVTARVIKELQIPGVSETISEDRFGKPEELYRSYYDPAKKFMRPARGISATLSASQKSFPSFCRSGFSAAKSSPTKSS